MEFQKINKVPLHKTIYDNLKNAILSGGILPGVPLNQNEISSEMGVSRMPVRDALRMLEMDGLIVYNKDFGYTVSDFSKEYIDDVILVRSIIEPAMLPLCKGKIDSETIQFLEGEIQKAYVAIEEGDLNKLNHYNREFHFRIYEKAGSAMALSIIEKLWLSYPKEMISEKKKRLDSWKEHEAMLEKIKAGDFDTAAELLREHIYSKACTV